MKTIYAVRGGCGEYSDAHEWPVAAFSERAPADEYSRMCNELAQELEPMIYSGSPRIHRLDPLFDDQAWTKGVFYSVEELPLDPEVGP